MEGTQTNPLFNVCLSVFAKLAPAAHFAQRKKYILPKERTFFVWVISLEGRKGGSNHNLSIAKDVLQLGLHARVKVYHCLQGVGHREATWERYHGALAGPFLYLLESPSVQSYKSYHR